MEGTGLDATRPHWGQLSSERCERPDPAAWVPGSRCGWEASGHRMGPRGQRLAEAASASGCALGSPGPGRSWAAASLGGWPLGPEKKASRALHCNVPCTGTVFSSPGAGLALCRPQQPRGVQAAPDAAASSGRHYLTAPLPLRGRLAWHQPVTLPPGHTARLSCPAVTSCGLRLGRAGEREPLGAPCLFGVRLPTLVCCLAGE